MSRKKKICVAAVLCLLALVVFAYGAKICASKAAYIYKEFRTKIETVEDLSQQILTNTEAKAEQFEFEYLWLDENKLIAHALGGIDGESYTNSMDALQLAYDNGFRVFEGDMHILDGRVVLMHDLSITSAQTGMDEADISYYSFMEAKLLGKYSTLDIDGIIRFLSEHPDAYFMTDTKYTDNPWTAYVLSDLVIRAMAYDESVLDRVIIQIYNQQMLDDVMSVYPFKSVVYTLYQSKDSPAAAMAFCVKRGIKAVTMPDGQADEDTIAIMDSGEIYLLTHTVNDAARISEALSQGVDAVYTDFTVPEMFE